MHEAVTNWENLGKFEALCTWKNVKEKRNGSQLYFIFYFGTSIVLDKDNLMR